MADPPPNAPASIAGIAAHKAPNNSFWGGLNTHRPPPRTPPRTHLCRSGSSTSLSTSPSSSSDDTPRFWGHRGGNRGSHGCSQGSYSPPPPPSDPQKGHPSPLSPPPPQPLTCPRVTAARYSIAAGVRCCPAPPRPPRAAPLSLSLSPAVGGCAGGLPWVPTAPPDPTSGSAAGGTPAASKVPPRRSGPAVDEGGPGSPRGGPASGPGSPQPPRDPPLRCRPLALRLRPGEGGPLGQPGRATCAMAASSLGSSTSGFRMSGLRGDTGTWRPPTPASRRRARGRGPK